MREPHRRFAVHMNFSRRGRFEAGHEAQQGAFACPVRSHESDHTGFCAKGDILEGARATAGIAEAHVAYFDDAHWPMPGSEYRSTTVACASSRSSTIPLSKNPTGKGTPCSMNVLSARPSLPISSTKTLSAPAATATRNVLVE